jgi:2-polyprenyl-6-methoxyphenol hydroxylase-like FAD-dependent oxidoreductase
MAIEDTAALANGIAKMLDTAPSTGLTDKQIGEAFQSYQNARYTRAKKITAVSNDRTREESYSTFLKKFTTIWVDPWVGDNLAGGKYKPYI